MGGIDWMMAGYTTEDDNRPITLDSLSILRGRIRALIVLRHFSDNDVKRSQSQFVELLSDSLDMALIF